MQRLQDKICMICRLLQQPAFDFNSHLHRITSRKNMNVCHNKREPFRGFEGAPVQYQPGRSNLDFLFDQTGALDTLDKITLREQID